MFKGIKYRYAFDSIEQRIVDVEKLEQTQKSRKKTFTCLGCNKNLTPVMGQQRKKHFRHQVDTELSCSSETYLHKLAKTRFYEIYKQSVEENLEFNIEYEIDQICTRYKNDYLVSCNLGKKMDTFDLIKYFDKAYLEKPEGSFIPDILLVGRNKDSDKLFVEIVVEHKATLEKRRSGYRIVEIYIKSENDIELFDRRFLSETHGTNFYNFKRKFKQDFCNGQCPEGLIPYSSCEVEYDFFVIYGSGKSILTRKTLSIFTRDLEKQDVSYHKTVLVKNRRSESYIEMVIEAFNEELKIKNCFLCRYHALNRFNDGETPVFCKFLKKSFNSNQAANCQSFKPDPQVFPQTGDRQSIGNIATSNRISKHSRFDKQSIDSITPSQAVESNSRFDTNNINFVIRSSNQSVCVGDLAKMSDGRVMMVISIDPYLPDFPVFRGDNGSTECIPIERVLYISSPQ